MSVANLKVCVQFRQLHGEIDQVRAREQDEIVHR